MKKFNFKSCKLCTLFKNPRVRHGSISTAITALVVIAVILLNVLVGALTDKFSLKYDMTKNHVFTITDESKDFIKSLDKDVNIVVLNTEGAFVSGGDYFVQANEVIKKYDQLSDKISLSYINLEQNPTYKAKYSNEDLEENSIIIECGDKHSVLTSSELFNVSYSYYGSQITSSKAEEAMTGAIMNIVSDNKINVSFIKGFDEADPSAFVSLLEKNNYNVISQDILTEDIDTNNKLAVIYAPARDYDNEAVDKLNKYLNNNGQFGNSVVYIADPNQNEMPTINSFLTQWGVKIGDGLVYETSNNKLLSTTSPFYTINEYVDLSLVQNLKNTSIPVCMPFGKPIDILDDTKVKTLLQFSETSKVVPGDADENWTPSEDDRTGPIPSATISFTTNEDADNSNVVVFDSVLAFDNTFLSRTSLNNSAYFLSLFNNLTDSPNPVTIESKSIDSDNLGANASQCLVLGIVFVLIIPLIIIVAGIVVFIKRRHK